MCVSPPSTFLLFLLLICPATLPCTAREFRFVFIFSGDLSDFGLTFLNNIARINLQKTLTQKYPNINTSHVLISNPTFDGCDSRFEKWCRAGANLFISDVGQQSCLAQLAQLYPSIAFVSFAGFITGPPNYANIFVRNYEPAYLAGFTAGLMAANKKVCIATSAPLPAVITDLTGFCRGVRNADPTVEIHVFCTDQMEARLLEVWIVNQSYAMGCDVVWVHSTGVDGIRRASELGMMSIAFFTDARLTMGETVLTSIVVDMTPAYVRAAEAVLNGTFEAETQKADWWMGWNWGTMRLADFSFMVPQPVQDKVLAQIPTLDRIFCGRVCTQQQCLCNSPTCCLTDSQLKSLGAYPDFIVNHGVVQLPGQACGPGQLATWHLDTFTMNCSVCPAGTYAYNADEVSECRPCPAAAYSLPGATHCTACPAGTYSDQSGLGQCVACPAGSIAPNAGSVSCGVCGSSLSNRERTLCESPSLLWLAGLAGGVVIGLLFVGACLLWYVRHHGKRNNGAAPKDPSQAFCIVFTDIQGSTSLWAAIPDVMAAALDAHHALVRRLIAKYHCYEVKTIGDSFMCATKSPSQAVSFALALQEDFVRHDWGTDRIDRAYAELTAPEIETPGCWNGLRVRVGIHYGHGDIKLDPTSKGYDYYGTVVNTAARIESVCHGGQTSVSAAVFEALGGQCPGAVWADLGLQPLRGLAEPLRLYQVLPEGPLSQRRFPPLRIFRLDSREPVLAQHPSACPLTSPVASMVPGILPSAQWADHHPLVAQGRITAPELRRHYHVLQAGLATLLAPLAGALRHELARELCAFFHVPNHGTDEPLLLCTLDGLIKRALPATVVVPPDQTTLLFSPPEVTARASPKVSARSRDALSSTMRLVGPRTAFGADGVLQL